MVQQDSELSILQALHSEYRKSLKGIKAHIHTFVHTSPVAPGKKRRVSQKIANVKLLIHNLGLLLQSAQKILRRLHKIDYIEESQANIEGDKQSDVLDPDAWFDNLLLHLQKSAQQVDRATRLMNKALVKSGFEAIEILLIDGENDESAKEEAGQVVTLAKRETVKRETSIDATPPQESTESTQDNSLQAKIDEVVAAFFHSKEALKYFDEVYLYRKELINRAIPLVKEIYERRYPGYRDVHGAIGENVLEFIADNDKTYPDVNCLAVDLLGRIKKEKVQRYKTKQLSKMTRESL